MEKEQSWYQRIGTQKLVYLVGIIIFAGIGTWALLGAHAATTSQGPLHDVVTDKVVGVGQSTTTALYKDVNDSSDFKTSDDNTSYVRSENGVPKATHVLSYGAYPANTTLTQATVN